MKGKLLFFLAALLAIAQGARADEVTVYSSATTAIRYVPVDGWNVNEYQKSEFVIPAAQLEAMDGGTISQMTFYMQTPADKVWPGNFQVFLKEVNSTTISDFYGTSGATTVYEGTLDATGSTLTITFNKGNYVATCLSVYIISRQEQAMLLPIFMVKLLQVQACMAIVPVILQV